MTHTDPPTDDLDEILDELEVAIKSASRVTFTPERLPAENGKMARLMRESAKDVAKTRLLKWREEAVVAGRKRNEGIGAYLAVTMLLQDIGYLLGHRNSPGFPSMTGQVIGELYDKIKKTLDDNVEYMRSPAELKKQRGEQGDEN